MSKKTLIIGNGVWSKTLQRVLSELNRDFIVATHDWKQQLNQVSKAIVATPAPTHFRIANELLQHGITTLIEKPAVLTLEHAEILEYHANITGTPIFCHTPYLYHDLIKQLAKDLNAASHINYSSYRANTAGNHRDGNSFINHGAHDLSILWELGIREDLGIKNVQKLDNLITVEASNAQGHFHIVTGELQETKTRCITANGVQIVADTYYLRDGLIQPKIRPISEPLKASLSDFVSNSSAKCGIDFIKWSSKVFQSLKDI